VYWSFRTAMSNRWATCGPVKILDTDILSLFW